MPRAEVTLPGATSSVPTARRFVDSLLTSWGQPDLAWAAVMCVSELSGNCALHARTEFTVRVQLERDVVRIEVRDGSPRVPSPRGYDTGATTGRGLRLVEEYSSSWGVDATSTGKTVWLVLDARPGAADPAEADAADVESLLARFGGDGQGPDAGRATALWPAAA